MALPVYRAIVFLRKHWKKAIGPTKGTFIHAFTARPVVHITVTLLIFTVTAANLQASTLPTSSGESSILFSLIGGEETGLIEETAATSRSVGAVSYLGAAYGVGTHQAQLAAAVPVTADHIALVTSGGSAMASTPVMPGATRTGLSTVSKVRTATETYVVQGGDTISTIAANFGLSQTTILWANNMTARDYIRPGQKLKILPIDGIAYTVKKNDTLSKLAKTYAVTTDEIREANGLDEETALTVSTELIIPGGKPIAPVIVRAPVINRIIDAIGTPGPSPDAGSVFMIWPTSGRVITQYWGWRHTGVDIDGHYDSPIYASDSGVVEVSGWGNGYGIQAVVNHENGYKTRYAHMSKIYVTPGQRVNKGEVIGMVGTTGNSTGTHLHFEVYNNGVRGNPLLFVR